MESVWDFKMWPGERINGFFYMEMYAPFCRAEKKVAIITR